MFCKPELVNILLKSLSFLQARQRLVVYGYVVMENHLHPIAPAENLSKEMGNFQIVYGSLNYRLAES